MDITPLDGDWLRTFRMGNSHWSVIALQANLNCFGNVLALDGGFGARTDAVVRAYQRHRGMKVDGIVGGATQERIAVELSTPAARESGLPVGLVKGLAENESSFMLACVTPHPFGAGFDLGVYQDAYPGPSTQAAYRRSLTIPTLASETAKKLRAQRDVYLPRTGSRRRAWELAALYHNWPYAAEKLSRGQYIYGSAAADAADREWVIEATGGRLRSAGQWANAYIAAATKYVDWSTA